VPPVTPDLTGRLHSLQREINAAAQGGIPAIISVLLFEDDDVFAFRDYMDELEWWLRARGAGDVVLVELRQHCQRPTGLRAPWILPRVWLDGYHPSPEELASLRPDTLRPLSPRTDYTPPEDGPDLPVAATGPQGPPVHASEGPARQPTESEQRTREARQRWQEALRRDGTPGADRVVAGASQAPTAGRTAASSPPVDVQLEQEGTSAPEAPELPLQVDEVLSLGGGRRRVHAPELLDGGLAGPLGGRP
jgi:hypothetical protein